MTNTVEQALEDVYASLHNNNEGIDQRIIALKIALKAQDMQSIEIDSAKIPQPNRQGRKVMQSYFKKRGVIVTFKDTKASDVA